MSSITFSVPGIHCEGCAALIRDVSFEFPAITSADVDVRNKTVTLTYQDGIDIDAWKREIESIGPEYNVHPA